MRALRDSFPVPLPVAFFTLYPVPVCLAFKLFNDPLYYLQNNHGSSCHEIEVHPWHMIKVQTAPLLIRTPPHNAYSAAETFNFKIPPQLLGSPRFAIGGFKFLLSIHFVFPRRYIGVPPPRLI
jgi:hypothetical protein